MVVFGVLIVCNWFGIGLVSFCYFGFVGTGLYVIWFDDLVHFVDYDGFSIRWFIFGGFSLV